MDFCNEISLSSFILTFYRISIYDLWFIGNAVVNLWKRDGILTTSSLSLSLSLFIFWTFEFMEFDATFQKWNCLDVFDVSGKQFSSETYKCARCLFTFPSRSRSGRNFIWNKNEKLRIFRFHLFFKRDPSLSLFLFETLWNTN